MFPQGFYIEPENRQYQTSKTNSIFLILSAITREIGGNKKDSLTKNINESSVAAGTGLTRIRSLDQNMGNSPKKISCFCNWFS
jgi:hypothetical protein